MLDSSDSGNIPIVGLQINELQSSWRRLRSGANANLPECLLFPMAVIQVAKIHRSRTVAIGQNRPFATKENPATRAGFPVVPLLEVDLAAPVILNFAVRPQFTKFPSTVPGGAFILAGASKYAPSAAVGVDVS